MDASEWVHSPAPRDPSEPVILDNVQDAFERARLRLQLRLSLERRVRAGRPTLLSFTAPKPTRVIRSFLPSSKSWIISPVNAPDENERELLVRQMAADEGLKLSDCLVWLMSHRMNGNGCSLMGAFKRLALHNSQWTDPNMTLRACGLLDPCFRDCPSWDLRDHILTCAEEFVSDNMLVPRPVLAVFTMLRIAMLAEADVADYFEANQAALYRQAIDFESRVSDPEHYLERDEVLRFMRFVIAKLKA